MRGGYMYHDESTEARLGSEDRPLQKVPPGNTNARQAMNALSGSDAYI
jgi:hypothetical protein